MAKTHNKKRNVGVIYELLTRQIAEAIISKNERLKKRCLKIINRHFHKGTELYKEFRLFNSLVNSSVSNKSVAERILIEASNACQDYDNEKLNREKSKLIREINYSIKNENPKFYSYNLSNYKTLATVQCLIEHWRDNKKLAIETKATYEDYIVEYLCLEKSEKNIQADKNIVADNLVLKIMAEKVNEKYASLLSPSQKSFIENYVLNSKVAEESIISEAKNIKGSTISLIDSYIEESEDKYIIEKSIQTKQKILNENFNDVNDLLISKCLTMLKLKEELEKCDE